MKRLALLTVLGAIALPTVAITQMLAPDATLAQTPLPQANAWAMIQRRAISAGIETKIGNHTFRATGITAYLESGGTIENAQAIAARKSTDDEAR